MRAASERRDEQTAPDERYVVVSIDSHVGPSVKEQLREYCEAKYLEDFDRFVGEMERHGRTVVRASDVSNAGGEETWSLQPGDTEAVEEFGRRAGIRHATQVDTPVLQRSYEHSLVSGLQDPAAREADMDEQGVAADVIFHGGLNGESIPFSTTGLVSWGDSSYNHLEAVGVRIYNRWLADFVSSAPERHAGIAHIPISDPEACVAEVEWAAKAGLKGVNLPAPRGDFPMLNDPVWEPLWAACEEANMTLNTHGGGGEHYPYKGDGASAMYMMETLFKARRGVWVMILGGVFERHPGLRLVLTEQWADWALEVLRDMDALYRGRSAGYALRASLPRPPSEYFKRNCYLGASFMSNGDAKMAIEHDLTDNIMWGDDYPHAEGTWPDTRESIRFAFSDIDPKYTRKYLGETAVDVYGFNRGELLQIAERICPTAAEVATPYSPDKEAPAGTYAFRTGPGKFV